MPKRRLTSAAVAKLKAGPKRRAIPDGGGLYLLIQPSGHKSWAMAFRGRGGKMTKLTLGPYSAVENSSAKPVVGAPLSLAAARRLAADINHRRAGGEHVTTAKTRRGADSFGDAARDFIREHAQVRVRGWRAQARLLGLEPDDLTEIDRGLASWWRDRPVTEITAGDIFAVADEAKRRGVPGLERRRRGHLTESRARALLSCLGRMFRWLLENRRIETNPCASVVRPPPPRSRDRVLDSRELAGLWRACDQLNPPFGAIVRLLVLTGCRLNEIARLQSGELVDGEIRLPSARTKNHRPHVVPLSELAQSVLATVQKSPGDSPFVFTNTGVTPVSGWSKVKARLDRAMGNPTHWTLHDIRRSVATHLAELGLAQPHIVEAILNHVSGAKANVAGVYNRAAYAAEKRDALELWAQHISKLIEGKPTTNVTPLRRV
jgi:integrase